MAASENLGETVGAALWLAHRYDEANKSFQFRFVPRERHRTIPFLSDQHLGVDASPLVVAENDVASILSSLREPVTGPHFLFHSAYCGSTMLARLFDVPGRSMGISEPQLLNDMAGWRRRGASIPDHARVMRMSLGLLARPFAPREAVVVKPSNVVNPLAAAMLALAPDARAVFLYAPLRDFLLSVARKGLWCRLWCRELLEGYLGDGFVQLGFEPRDYFRQSDLQVAAIGWLAQQAAFSRLVDRFGDRVATLNSAILTGDPAGVAAAAAKHFGIGGLTVADFADHGAISRDSKSGAEFGVGQRDRDLAAADAAHGDEVDQVVGWAEAVATGANIPMTLGRALAP